MIDCIIIYLRNFQSYVYLEFEFEILFNGLNIKLVKITLLTVKITPVIYDALMWQF